MSPITAEVGLSAIRKIADIWSAGKPDSLIDYTKQLRVEPLALIDQDVLYHDAAPEIMQTLLSIFAGYYLQAVAVSTTVGNIAVGRHLDKLNPSRDTTGNALGSIGGMLSVESYKHALPVPAQDAVALEAAGDYVPLPVRKRIEERKARLAEADQAGSARFGKDTVGDLKELANLAVGKMLEVTLTDGKHQAVVPIAIRLMANAVASDSLVHILSHGSQDTSVKERWHAWRAGRLEFIRDFILCQDLIDERRKALMKDKDGLYSAITARKRSGILNGILSGQPSVGMASNLAVLSSDTAQQLELKTNYSLKNFAQRQKIFDETALMIMVVLDKQWERVTFYHRGIATITQLGIRDLKAANRGSGPDVSDILRAYQLGNAPSL